MPRSIIEAGLADFVLEPEEIASMLISHVSSHYGRSSLVEACVEQIAPVLGDLLDNLKATTGHDFTEYKTKTLSRRIARRMSVCGIDDARSYVDYLKSSVKEQTALFHELLIRVTGFFRDSTAFDVLASIAIPRAASARRCEPAPAHMGAWVLYRRRGLQHRHAAEGIHGPLSGAASRADLCHRHR